LTGAVEGKYYINVSQYDIDNVLTVDQPVLTTTNRYKWSILGGYLYTQDGRYLIRTANGYELSYSTANAVGVYTYDVSLVQILDPLDDTPYLLVAYYEGVNKCVSVNMSQ
jgi:hypothetical protein